LEDSRRDCLEQAWRWMFKALPFLFDGMRPPRIRPSSGRGVAERFADADATIFAQLSRGHSLILKGQVAGE
jgi:hypothetical protein